MLRRRARRGGLGEDERLGLVVARELLAAALIGGALEQVDRERFGVRTAPAAHLEPDERERSEETAYAADDAASDRTDVAVGAVERSHVSECEGGCTNVSSKAHPLDVLPSSVPTPFVLVG